MKKEEMMLKATQMLAKGKFKLKKAGPTIMIVGAAIGGVTAAVLACKATLKAEEIIAEHNAQIETIHATKAQVDSGEMQLKDDMKKDITTTYIHTAVWLAKVYAPAVTLGSLSLACMFGSHHIMSKRNASLTAAYIAIDKAFNEYIGRVTERFGDRVQQELEHSIKAVEVESTAKNEDGTEEVIREYADVARDANDPYSMIFDESCSLWEKDSMLNAMTIRNVENAANRRLRTNGHLFLNEVIDMLDPYGKGCHRTAVGQVAGWIYDPKDETKQNCVSLGTHCYVPGNEALNDFINGDERSVILHFNCDGPIINKI
jgi:hypothetical protein